MNQEPIFTQQQTQAQLNSFEPQIKALLSSTRGWILFLGILNIVYASLYTLITLGIGIIVMWVPFLLGIFLINAATKIKNYTMMGDPVNLVEYHKQMKNFFLTTGIITIIAIALGVIAVVVILFTGLAINPNEFNFPWGIK